jgi:hypothetical protein
LLDGVDDLVEVPDSPDFLVAALTAETWINPARLGVSQFIISQYLDGIPSDASFRLIFGSEPEFNRAQIAMFSGGGDWMVSEVVDPTFSVGTWTNFTGLWNGGETPSGLEIYINETPTTRTETETGDFTLMADSSEPVRIGAARNSEAGLNAFFGGLIDEIALFSGALPDTVRKNNYCAFLASVDGAILPPICN